MEIKFNNLSYDNYFDNINLEINSGSIVGFISDDMDYLSKLLYVDKRPSSGEVVLDNIVVKRSNHLDDISILKRKIAYLDSDNLFFCCSTVKDEIKSYIDLYSSNKRSIIRHIMDSLKLVDLDEDYLSRNPNELSYIEKKKVMLACLLSYNPEVLVLNDFSSGLLFKDREYFKKLFLKLKKDYKKTIILLSTDLTFMFSLIDKYYFINNGKIIIEDNDFYNEELYKYIDLPKIIEFTTYVNDNGFNINKYVDIKELIKELYRVIK